jgi:hypothetical protein
MVKVIMVTKCGDCPMVTSDGIVPWCGYEGPPYGPRNLTVALDNDVIHPACPLEDEKE